MNIYLSLLMLLANPIIVWPPSDNPLVNGYQISLYNKNYYNQLTVQLIRTDLALWIPENELMYNVSPGLYEMVIQPLINGAPHGTAMTNDYYYKLEGETVKPLAPQTLQIIP